jgi:hypothetical protein
MKKKPLILGLCGRAGAGKSYLAHHLWSTRSFKIVSLAAPMKEMLRSIGIEAWRLYGEGKELPHPTLGGHTVRWALQTLGTEWGRNCLGRDVWVNIALAKIEENSQLGLNSVVDDVRYINEASVIKEAGGYIVAVRGPVTTPESLSITKALHTSEHGLPQSLIDHTILNDHKHDSKGELDALINVYRGDNNVQANN